MIFTFERLKWKLVGFQKINSLQYKRWQEKNKQYKWKECLGIAMKVEKNFKFGITKDLSLYKNSVFLIFATWWRCKPLIFQTLIKWYNRIHILKYLRDTTLGCKDIVTKIRVIDKDSIPICKTEKKNRIKTNKKYTPLMFVG